MTMSDEIPNFHFVAFRYPLFHVDMVVLAAIAACFCLLAIWAGLSARHWFWRAAAMVLSVLALLPIQAHQPALMLIVALPAISLTVAAMNRRGIGPQAASAKAGDALKLSFGLKELLLAVLVTAALCYGATVLIERRMDLDFLRAATGAVGLWLFATLCYGAVFARRRRWLIVAALIVVILLNAAVEQRPGYGWGAEVVEVQELQDFTLDMEDIISSTRTFRIERFACLALAGLEFCLLLAGLLMLACSNFVRPKGRARYLVLGVCALVGLRIMVVAALLYFHMVPDSALESPILGGPDTYPRLLQIARDVQTRNPSQVSLADLTANRDVASRQGLEALYEEGIILTAQPGQVPVDVVRKYFRVSAFDDLIAFRHLARAWQAEGNSLAQKDKFDEAATYHLASAEMGINACRGGVVLHELVGNGCESIGVAGLASIRARLSRECARNLIMRLGKIEVSREPIHDIVSRDQASVRESAAWRSRFALAIAEWWDVRLDESEQAIVASVRDRREAALRLLMADLAIRLFQREQGRLPEALSSLVPEYLASVPIDPYSNQPLVYRPEGQSFVLYSVGDDGRDNGGRFRTLEESVLEKGYDVSQPPLGLDELFEPDASSATQAGAGLLDALEKSRLVLELILQPIILASEANQDAGRLSVPGDDDFFFLGQTQELREVVFDFR